MNMRADVKERPKGSDYMDYLKRKEKICVAAHKTLGINEETTERVRKEVIAAGLFADYMEDLKKAVEKRLDIEISYAELDIIFPTISNICAARGRQLTKKIESEAKVATYLTHMRLVNKQFDLEDNEKHKAVVTQLVLGNDPTDIGALLELQDKSET